MFFLMFPVFSFVFSRLRPLKRESPCCVNTDDEAGIQELCGGLSAAGIGKICQLRRGSDSVTICRGRVACNCGSKRDGAVNGHCLAFNVA